MTEGIVHLDAAAVRASMQVVATVSEGDLARPTPCAGWTLADLLAHMTAHHNGFAAAAAGDGADPDRWELGPADPATLVAEYVSAADRVVTAFGADGVLDREFSLPVISTETTFPARHAIAFHLVDYAVHGWDVARSLGLEYDLAPDVVLVANQVALVVPDDSRQPAPGAAFAPRIAIDPKAGALDRLVAQLGRRPDWPALSRHLAAQRELPGTFLAQSARLLAGVLSRP